MAKVSDLESELELQRGFEGTRESEAEMEGLNEHELFSSNGHGSLQSRSGSQEFDFENEAESEQFFGAFKKFFKKAAPFLKKALKVAAPLIGGAVAGPAGSLIGGAASSLLREAEGESELELESEWEGNFEQELESLQESRHSAGTPRQNWMPEDYMAEAMAAWASKAESESEAEAFIGAATATSLSRSDEAKIRSLVPFLVNGAATLSQVLRKQPVTRPVLRVIPEVARLTHRDLSRMVLSGRPVNRKTAARAFYRQANQMFTDPRLCGNTLYRNIRAQRDFARMG